MNSPEDVDIVFVNASDWGNYNILTWVASLLLAVTTFFWTMWRTEWHTDGVLIASIIFTVGFFSASLGAFFKFRGLKQRLARYELGNRTTGEALQQYYSGFKEIAPLKKAKSPTRKS